MVDVVAELREVKFGRTEMIGTLGLEEFGTYPVEDTRPFGGGGLLLFLWWHVAEMQLFFDQAPLFEGIVVGKHVGSEAFQVETALLGVRVMAIHAIGFKQGKYVLVVSCQVSLRLSDQGRRRQQEARKAEFPGIHFTMTMAGLLAAREPSAFTPTAKRTRRPGCSFRGGRAHAGPEASPSSWFPS